MDFGHAQRFATLEARRLSGDLYPGPVLMPRSLLRALDPLVAVMLGPAQSGGETFEAALQRSLRGRPDGPLLLGLWATASAGEIPSQALRTLAGLLAEPPPEEPATRAELLAWLRPRTGAAARCILPLFQRTDEEYCDAAETLGCGLVLSAWLRSLGRTLSLGQLRFPREELEAVGLAREELEAAVPTPPVRAFLAREADWARTLLDAGRPLHGVVGARLRRGMRAMTLRAELLLRRVEDPARDPFRIPPHLGGGTRWRCALRALAPIPPLAAPVDDS